MITDTRANDAERMDRHYRWQRLVYDATRKNYLLGRMTLLRSLRPDPGQRVLEVGCGTAWNLGNSVKLYPHAQHFGFDVSNAMLSTGRSSLARRGLGDRIRLAQGDATSFDPVPAFGVRDFDRVFVSYALSMIPAWQQALRHSMSLVAAGGELHIVDFGQCEELPAVAKSALFKFLDYYSVTPRADMVQQISSLAAAEGHAFDCQRLYRGYAIRAVIRRRSTS